MALKGGIIQVDLIFLFYVAAMSAKDLQHRLPTNIAIYIYILGLCQFKDDNDCERVG